MTESSIRDQLRATIFSSTNAEYKRIPYVYKGAQLELKQPNLEQVNQLWQIEGTTARAIYMLIALAYVPGTDIRVFEDTDQDNLIQMPYGAEMVRLTEIMTEFITGNSKESEKNLEATPSSIPSTH